MDNAGHYALFCLPVAVPEVPSRFCVAPSAGGSAAPFALPITTFFFMDF
jgi:hypothetical protein